jgi:hypothetical protein
MIWFRGTENDDHGMDVKDIFTARAIDGGLHLNSGAVPDVTFDQGAIFIVHDGSSHFWFTSVDCPREHTPASWLQEKKHACDPSSIAVLQKRS